MMYGLPKTVSVCGTDYSIRYDFRDILEIIGVLNDMELSDRERGFLTLLIFYPDFEEIPQAHYNEAVKQCFWFINCGEDPEEQDYSKPVLMDWEKDFPVIIAPINRIAGHDVRTDEACHWWTFLGYYMEIGDCTFAQIVHIRTMLKKGKKLDKSDAEWYRENQKLVDMKTKLTSEEEALFQKWGGG